VALARALGNRLGALPKFGRTFACRWGLKEFALWLCFQLLDRRKFQVPRITHGNGSERG